MTRLHGVSAASPDASQPSTGGQLRFSRSKLPPDAPDVISRNTIEISDPVQILSWYKYDRRRQFNLLVRRYKRQILYGCQNLACSTPTCATYRRRTSEGPFRHFTELSARSLACYLASLDNAEDGLCRNRPVTQPELKPQGSQPSTDRRSRSPSSCASDQRSKVRNLHKSDLCYPTNDVIPETSSNNQPGVFISEEIAEKKNQPGAVPESAPKTKDPKSFTQNLFDTLSLRMVEWLPLRRPPEVFEKHSYYPIQSPVHLTNTAGQPHVACSRADNSSDPRRGEIIENNRHTRSSKGLGHSAAVELKLPNQHVKRLSLTEIDQWRHSPRQNLEEKPFQDQKPTRKLSFNTHVTADEFISVPSPPALKRRQRRQRNKAPDADSWRVKNQQQKQGHTTEADTRSAESLRPVKDRAAPPFPRDHFSVTLSPTDNKPRDSSQCNAEYVVTPVETITHLSGDIVDGLKHMLVKSEEDAQIWKEELAFIGLSGNFDDSERCFATPRQQQAFNFVAQSVFYALGNTKQVLRSFRKSDVPGGPDYDAQGMPATRLDVQQLQPSFSRLFTICPWDVVLQSLWRVLEKVFIPPKELCAPGRLSRRSLSSSVTAPVPAPTVPHRMLNPAYEGHISDTNTADIITIAFFALVSSLPKLDAQTWHSLFQMRAVGEVASDVDMQKFPPASMDMILQATDKFEHELALRLVSRLVRALAARQVFHGISKAREVYSHESSRQRKHSVLDMVIDRLSEHHNTTSPRVDDYNQILPPPCASAFIVEWIRTLFLREWDGKAQVSRSSAVGGAIQILDSMYRERHRIGLVPKDFHTAFLSERLDPLEMPVEWLASLPNNKTMHLLSYPFLFPPSALVIYFRALNYSAMSKYYEAAMTTTRHITQTAFGAIQIHDDVDLLARMKTSMSTYLVLMVSRDNALPDALNQLWRRERRELMRPLKVQMGLDEGEEGLDHGGVQQEFFRVVLAEALDPSYGMFTLDSQTQVSWFQPCSCEPLYKFELIGILISLAVYNGLTLPVNFPLAFYRKLLGLKVKNLNHIRDGWPELAKGLDSLLGWSDGDVGDIFMRTYEFSFEVFGSVESVDMQQVSRDAAWPQPSKPALSEKGHGQFTTWSDVPLHSHRSSPCPPFSMAAEAIEIASSGSGQEDSVIPADESTLTQPPTLQLNEPSLVTNANRSQFVKDYVFWLTDKSIRPQFDALLRGFHTCLDRSALSIFTPEALKAVVEGIQEIDLQELEQCARYEGGFDPNHRSVRDFWSIVRGYSAAKKAQLLEFVTASDRVPVNGIGSIMFVVQRNGVGDARLPTSLTCFGRLLLPEYSSREVLEEKLERALENARGFGVA